MPSGPERGGTDEADGMDPEQVEPLVVPDPLDVARPHHWCHVPAQPPGWPHGMNGESRHPVIAFAAREQDVTVLAESSQVLEELPLVHLAARARLRRDPAVRRQDAHQRKPSARATLLSASTMSSRSRGLSAGEFET